MGPVHFIICKPIRCNSFSNVGVMRGRHSFLGTNIEFTLKQHGFELHGSTYMLFFFNSKYYSTIQSVDGEPQIQRANCKLYADFQLHEGSVPHVIQWSTVPRFTGHLHPNILVSGKLTSSQTC